MKKLLIALIALSVLGLISPTPVEAAARGGRGGAARGARAGRGIGRAGAVRGVGRRVGRGVGRRVGRRVGRGVGRLGRTAGRVIRRGIGSSLARGVGRRFVGSFAAFRAGFASSSYTFGRTLIGNTGVVLGGHCQVNTVGVPVLTATQYQALQTLTVVQRQAVLVQTYGASVGAAVHSGCSG